MPNVRRRPGFCLTAAWVLGLGALVSGCASGGITSGGFQGFSYDPPGGTVTTDRVLDEHPLRTIGFRDAGVWFSNEFPGGRMHDVVRTGEASFRVIIRPENGPINNSPWYAFQVWSEREQAVEIELSYPGYRHRYAPRADGGLVPVHSVLDSVGLFTLTVGPDPVTISAQEVYPNQRFIDWKLSLASDPRVGFTSIGSSRQGRDLYMVRIASDDGDATAATAAESAGATAGPAASAQNERRDRGLILVTGRQHPPEIPGYLVMKAFLERVIRDGDELSARFLEQFEVWAVPMMNPDGADGGFWRHNAGGVDLNRDWSAFNQPETRAVRDAFLQAKAQGRTVWYGIDFHSTDENIFYPIDRGISTFPEDLTYRWLEAFEAADPGMPFTIEPFDTSSPIAKNWIWSTFGADAVTFEVDDSAPRDRLARFADVAAETLMRLLLDEAARSDRGAAHASSTSSPPPID